MTDTRTGTNRRKNSKQTTLVRGRKTDGTQQVGINVLIPTALHKRLRVKALTEELSMSEAIEAAVKAWLAR